MLVCVRTYVGVVTATLGAAIISISSCMRSMHTSVDAYCCIVLLKKSGLCNEVPFVLLLLYNAAPITPQWLGRPAKHLDLLSCSHGTLGLRWVLVLGVIHNPAGFSPNVFVTCLSWDRRWPGEQGGCCRRCRRKLLATAETAGPQRCR